MTETRYNKLSAEDFAALAAIVGEERCLSGAAIPDDYAHDELGGIQARPEVLVRVQSTDEVAQIMRHANLRRIPVVVRGAGTGLVGAAVPVHGGILMETTQMNRILELDRENLTVTVQPGVLLMDLAAYVQEQGFLYPPDPGEKSATIGGNISTNAGGMRAVKYGVTRDYVRGLTCVLPDGEALSLGGKVVKNSSGYSLKDLIVGSEGTLAVVTEAVLRLVPLPSVSVSLLVPFPSMEDTLDAVPELLRGRVLPTAIEFLSRETILFAEDFLGKRFPDTAYPTYLLLTFDGNDPAQVERDWQAAADLCLTRGAADVLIVDTDERKDAVWKARGAFLEAIKASTSEMDECDVVVPRTHVSEFLRFTQLLAAEIGLRIPSFGHAGDGNLHLYLCRDDLPEDVFRQRLAAGFAALYRKAAEFGGQISGEHGVGWAKRDFLVHQLGDAHIALMTRIKAAFDPNNILNPDKIFVNGK